MKKINFLKYITFILMVSVMFTQSCSDDGGGSEDETAVCGNGAVESGEACDDGNTVTETCAVGETSCTVCDATCNSVAGALLPFAGNPAGTWYGNCNDKSYFDGTNNQYESETENFTFTPGETNGKDGDFTSVVTWYTNHNCGGTPVATLQYSGTYTIVQSLNVNTVYDINAWGQPLLSGATTDGHKTNITVSTIEVNLPSGILGELQAKFSPAGLTWAANCNGITADTSSTLTAACLADINTAELNADASYESNILPHDTTIYTLLGRYADNLLLGYEAPTTDMLVEANRSIMLDERHFLTLNSPTLENDKPKGSWKAGACKTKLLSDGVTNVYEQGSITFTSTVTFPYYVMETVIYADPGCTGTILGTIRQDGSYTIGNTVSVDSVTADDGAGTLTYESLGGNTPEVPCSTNCTAGYELDATINNVHITYSQTLIDDLSAKDTGGILGSQCYGTWAITADTETASLSEACKTELNTIDPDLSLSPYGYVYTIVALDPVDYLTLWIGFDDGTNNGSTSALRNLYFNKIAGEEAVYMPPYYY